MSTGAAVLEKAITLFQWNRGCLLAVAELACSADAWSEQMRRLEDALERTPGDRPDAAVGAELGAGPLRTLYDRAAESAPLNRLFRDKPRFSEMDPAEVSAAACVSDVRPHPRDLLTTRDGVFLRVFAQVAGGAEVSEEKLLLDDFAWLCELAEAAPHAERLAATAAAQAGPGPAWTEAMRELERELEQGDAARAQPEALTPAARELLAWARSAEPGAEQALRLLLGPLRLSMLLREEVMAFHARLPLPTPARDLPPQERARVRAAKLSALVPVGGPLDPRPGLRFRAWAAGHFIQLRKFAKLDALFRGWPELGQLLYADRTAITALEAQLISPQPLVDDQQRLWEERRKDASLVRLLSLRPLFRDIYPAELRKYMLVSQALSANGDAGPGSPTAMAAVLDQAADQEALRDVMIKIIPSAEPDELAVTLTVGTQPPVSGTVRLARAEIEQMRVTWRQRPNDEPSVPLIVSGTPDTATRQPSPGEFRRPIEKLGRFLFERLLPPAVGEALSAVLAEPGGLRIVWRLEGGSPVAGLPLEGLYVPSVRMFPALTRKHSVVRSIQPGVQSTGPVLGRPLRVLAVLSNPIEVAKLNVQAEAEVLRRVLEPAVRDGRVRIEVLSEADATLERLQGALRTFRPHMFHYVGHGEFREDRQEGALVLHSEDGPQVVPDADVVTLLHDAGIQLALLNGCETGRASSQDVVSGIAARLVHRGVPAVVSALQPIEDDAAILFTREFYRTFVDGHSLEAAVAEGRKALSVEQWNWTAYALLTSTTNLRDIRLPPALVRSP